ncbi:MAG: L,D-transpeptidase family protein [Steroidobacteraceae bacterium]|nr:L,D-transpeptidase family protein [Steroidobacteraceae bacterium]MDW8257995.1 L,D-transpeptidase family protein [Gammaproteobacteria bacterium]
MYRVLRSVFALSAALAPVPLVATELRLDAAGETIFGEIQTVRTRSTDTLLDLARQYSLGYEELTRVNPHVDPWLPGEGTEVLLPLQRILPPGPRQGIVVNLAEHRLYYFVPEKNGPVRRVLTYPVSIGKMDWRTPLGSTRIVEKRVNPTWIPPPSVRKEHAARGEPLPAVVPPGPDNPLGAHAMRLGLPGGAYLIHGTNNPAAVGMPVTHGCIRMYPEDIAELFPLVPVGTPVTLLNEPIKLLFNRGEVWIEVHPPVDAEGKTTTPDPEALAARLTALLGPRPAAVHWDAALQALREARGIPTLIGLEVDTDPFGILQNNYNMPAAPGLWRW